MADFITIKCGGPFVQMTKMLGPLLFLLYTNDICNHIGYGKTVIYADDCTYLLPTDDPIASLNIVYV